MSARVMLMVLHGEGPRIRCAKQFGTRRVWAMAYFDVVLIRLGGSGQPLRAWLVEAESADAARKVIEHYERDPDATCVHGRVLASGGKRDA